MTPTVYAQADLDALQRVGDPGLSAIATNDAADIVDQILGVKSVRGATLLGDGPLTGPVVGLLSQLPGRARPSRSRAGDITAAGLRDGRGRPASTLATRRVHAPRWSSRPFDPTVGAALAGAGTEPSAPSYLDASLTVPSKHDSAVARRQDALAAAAVARAAARTPNRAPSS